MICGGSQASSLLGTRSEEISEPLRGPACLDLHPLVTRGKRRYQVSDSALPPLQTFPTDALGESGGGGVRREGCL